jgi:hypothetical protein
MAALRDHVAHGEVPAGGGRFVAGEESEEAEYDALSEAADAAGALLDGPGRRVVLVADVPDPDAAFPTSLVVAVNADTEPVEPGAGELPELGWYAAQELPDLLAAGG